MSSIRKGILVGIAAIALAVWAGAAWASSVPSGTNANVFLLGANGEPVASYQLGGALMSVDSRAAAGGVEVSVGGVWTVVPTASASSSYVGVSRVNNSWPMTAPGMAPMSVVSLVDPIHDAANLDDPGATISPGGGLFPDTTRVTLRVYQAPGNTNPVTLSWTKNGVAGPGTSDTTVHDYVVASGAYTYSLTASQTDAFGVLHTKIVTETIEIVPGTDPRRDSDGDGTPDQVEVDWGLDPLDGNDTGQDSDGDGWSDLEERMRGSDPDDASNEPIDSDGDGWSDWDEQMRGTSESDSTDYPTARRLTEVEYELSGETWTDLTTPATTGDLRVMGIWGGPHVEVEHEALDVWGPYRCPAGDPLIASAQQASGETPGETWDAHSWVDATPDIQPADVADAVAASGNAWTTGSEWLAAAEGELPGLYVQPATTAISPTTALGVALLEVAVAWEAGYFVGEPVLLGATDGIDHGAAASALQARYDGGLGELHWDLVDWAGTGQPLEAAATERDAVYAGVATASERATRTLAVALQQDPATSTERFRTQLVARVGRDALGALSSSDLSVALTPTLDGDADGLTGEDELFGGGATATDPLLLDTDGDAYSDSVDPCPLQVDNECLLADSLSQDSDSDGTMDALDNCLNTANPLQLDGNSDGIGNACEAPAVIQIPVGNRVVVPGTVLEFQSLESANAVPPVTYEWRLDGALVSTDPDLGNQTFSTPGTYLVTLTVSDAATTAAVADQRSIEVLPLP